MITVILLNDIQFPQLPTQQQFQQWVNQATHAAHDKIPKGCTELCISIVDKKTSAAFNATYRQKKGPTNILSFTYKPTPGITPLSLGDCAICAELVEEEARLQNTPRLAHWAHLTIHGVLHLLGYDHIHDHDANIMEPLEIKILADLGFDNPYHSICE
jgi:probable rRNA maturation factor